MLDVLKRQKHRFLYYFLVLGLLIGVIVLATVFRNDGIAVAAVVALLIYLYVFINAFDHYLKCGGCLRLITKAQMSDTLDDLPDHALNERDFKASSSGATAFADSKILCGSQAFVSDSQGLVVLPYALVSWVFPQHTRVFGSKKLGTLLMLRTVDGQSFDIGIVQDEEAGLLALLKQNNPDILIGYSKENRQTYKDICRKWKQERGSRK